MILFRPCIKFRLSRLLAWYSTSQTVLHSSESFLLSRKAVELGRDMGLLSSSPATKEQYQIILQMLTDRSYNRSKVPNNERLVDLGKQISVFYQHHPQFSKTLPSLFPEPLLTKLIDYYHLPDIIKYDTETVSDKTRTFQHTAYAILGTLYLQKGAKEALEFIYKHTLQ